MRLKPIPRISKYYLTNNKIRSPKLRVIDDEGGNVGVLDTVEALNIARERGLDLVVVAEKAEPPVAKIIDFKKFLYDQKQKESKGKAKKTGGLKEFRLSPRTAEFELNHRVARAIEFIQKERARIRFNVVFKGREIRKPEFGRERLEKAVAGLSEHADVIEPISFKGSVMSVTLAPKK